MTVLTSANLTDHTPRKKRLRKELCKVNRKLKLSDEKSKDITEKQFLAACDKLSPQISAIVKCQVHLKSRNKSNKYTK